MFGFMKAIDMISHLNYKPKYQHDKCIKSKSLKSTCTICKDVCPHKAISINRRTITIDDNCSNCNECVAHCPSNALIDTGKKFLGQEEKVYLICGKLEDENKLNPNVKLRCLNFLSLKILLNLYILGFREIHTNIDKCLDCETSSNFNKELEKVNSILSKLDKDLMSIKNRNIEDLLADIKAIEKSRANVEVDRRDFFKQIAKNAYSKTYEIAPPTLKGQSWHASIDILKQWNKDNKEKVAIFNVSANPNKCIRCGACEKLCPEKVWETKEDILEERLDLCNGCKLCQDICPTKAKKVEEDIRLIERQTFKKQTRKCDLCNKEYSSYKNEIDICSTCIGKEAFKK